MCLQYHSICYVTLCYDTTSKPDETEKRQSELNQRLVAPRGKKAKR